MIPAVPTSHGLGAAGSLSELFGQAGRGLGAALWCASLAATLVWWAPAILLALARLLLGMLRFRLALGLGWALVAVGLRGIARRVYEAEHRRAERRLRAMPGRTL